MAQLIDLTKKVAIVLEKKQIANVRAQVGFAIDVSGSMQGLFQRGTMHEVVQRTQAIANKFDDNQTLDVWVFDNGVIELEPATPDMFDSYVKDHILSRRDIWGGTSFAPALNSVEAHYFAAPKTSFLNIFKATKEEDKKDPVYLIMLTDGENDDKTQAERVIRELQNKNIYIQFVGVGSARFDFIKEMADTYPHVGFVDFSDLSSVSDEQMYETLLNDEFVAWAKKNA